MKDVIGHRLSLRSRESVAEPRPPFEVTVVAATPEEVGAVLGAVERLWRGLSAAVTVLLPVVVQFPAQLTEPPVPPGFLERRLRAAVAGHDARRIEGRVLLCRDVIEAVRDNLKPHSFVVIGRRKWRFPVAGASLARALEKAGHSVVLTR